MSNKISFAKKGTNEWKLFNYLRSHESVTSRESKYPPLEIMDLPKVISVLISEGYSFTKIKKKTVDKYGITKKYTEYVLDEEVELYYV